MYVLNLLVYKLDKLKLAPTSAELDQPRSPTTAQTFFGIRALTFDVGYIRRGQKFLRTRGSKLGYKVRGVMRSQARAPKIDSAATESSKPSASSPRSRCGPSCRFEKHSGPTVVSALNDGMSRGVIFDPVTMDRSPYPHARTTSSVGRLKHRMELPRPARVIVARHYLQIMGQ